MRKLKRSSSWHTATVEQLRNYAASCRTPDQFKTLNVMVGMYRTNYVRDVMNDHHSFFHFIKVLENRRLDAKCEGKRDEILDLTVLPQFNINKLIKLHADNFANKFNFG